MSHPPVILQIASQKSLSVSVPGNVIWRSSIERGRLIGQKGLERAKAEVAIVGKDAVVHLHPLERKAEFYQVRALSQKGIIVSLNGVPIETLAGKRAQSSVVVVQSCHANGRREPPGKRTQGEIPGQWVDRLHRLFGKCRNPVVAASHTIHQRRAEQVTLLYTYHGPASGAVNELSVKIVRTLVGSLVPEERSRNAVLRRKLPVDLRGHIILSKSSVCSNVEEPRVAIAYQTGVRKWE